MNFTHPFFPRHAFLFKGGGVPPAPVIVQAPQAPQPTNPPDVVTPPANVVSSPPATQTSLEVTQARMDAQRQARARRGVNSTILAAGGGGSGNGSGSGLGGQTGGRNTLLGGG